MAMTITVTINLDESGTYTPAEAAVIEALAKDVASPAADQGTAAPAAPAEKSAASKAADARIAEARAKQAAEAKAAKAAEAKVAKAAAAVEEETKPAEDTPDDQAIAEMEAQLAADAPTVGDAVTAATDLISAGQQAKVKQALEGCGVKRVSELKGDSIAAFITALAA